ncbi:MAG: U32 family peptidase [Roseburia sp.]|nr:U32 family peptidase [Roseburia sp.]
MSKKVELLAPAGDFSCFQAAINAGADAVYLGGTRFGARAYAGNFTEEELAEALRIAHLFGRRIYLTVNTLVKEKELSALIPYVRPLYEAGLDGVIVQDFGVARLLRESFPELPLHASTQMTITGVYGAAFAKRLGVCRVVPARELSLEEIRDIKEQTGLEIEVFIHGAMCYAYSGQCLLSSVIGGRSGNRGRCAGPCRLPYTDENGKTLYPLSLKDMYALPLIPKLIDAGADSFKIEGRMKAPEYVAGVTAVYRKYIDSYLADPRKPYRIAPQDEALLRSLYIRTDICGGYYERHNGRSMVTITEPGYSGSSPEVFETIREKYLSQTPSIPVRGHASIRANRPARLSLSCEGAVVTAEGETVSPAVSRPLKAAELRARFEKTGDTFFAVEEMEIDTDNASFLPVKTLNALRRQACALLEREILQRHVRTRESAVAVSIPDERASHIMPEKAGTAADYAERPALNVVVMTAEQLAAALSFPELERIYIDADLWTGGEPPALSAEAEGRLGLALPHILRKRSYHLLPAYRRLLEEHCRYAVLVRNPEELQWLTDIDYIGQITADYTLYAWNRPAAALLRRFADRVTLPVELNRRELSDLGLPGEKELPVYGRLPLMYSANCIRRTTDKCIRNTASTQNIYRLTDRYKNIFPVLQNCRHCYNILYNTVPLSLHGRLAEIKDMGFGAWRMDFTTETGAETRALIGYYVKALGQTGPLPEAPLKDFTNGHYRRGVE